MMNIEQMEELRPGEVRPGATALSLQTCSWLEDQSGSQHLSWEISLQGEAKRSSCRVEAVWAL